MKRVKSVVVLFVIAMLFVWAAAAGGIPQKMTYQGKLTDSSGNPLTGTYSIVFTIYDASSGGSNLWTETRSVPATKGAYSLVLGEGTAIGTSVFDGNERWLGIKVESDSEMIPRMKIVSVGNAYKAYDADNLGGHPVSYFTPSSEGGSYVLKTGDKMTGRLTIEGATNTTVLKLDAGGGDNYVDLTTNGALRITPNGDYWLGPSWQFWPTGTAGHGMYFDAGSATGTDLFFRSAPGGSNALVIKQGTGNAIFSNYVGIGTTPPTAPLHISGASATTVLKLDAGGGSNYVDLTTNGALRITANGNYETGPSWQFWPTGTAGHGMYFDAGSAAGADLFFRTAPGGSNALVVKQGTGYVGIGTSEPSATLEVKGIIKATAFEGNGAALTNVPATDSTKVLKTGDTMGETNSGAALNRFRFNIPAAETPDNNAVVSIGGEHRGSLEALGFPANTFSTSLFSEAKNDGTAAYYIGLWGKADKRRNASEHVAIAGEAYGSGAYGLFFGGGKSDEPIDHLAFIQGYADNWGLEVNNLSSATGGGLLVNSSNADGYVSEFKYGGSDVFTVSDDRCDFSQPVYYTLPVYHTLTSSGVGLTLDGGGADNYFDISSGAGAGLRIISAADYNTGPSWQFWPTGTSNQGMYFDAGSAAGADLFFRSAPSGSNALVIKQGTGYVGIGTPEPTATLEVVGIVKATAFVGDGSALANIPVTDDTKVLKTGDTMTGNLTVEGEISCEGFSMGDVSTGTSLNRLRLNDPDAPDNNSVVNVGGEYDGSVAALGYPAGTISTQIFGQARNDGTAGGAYVGIAGMANTERDAAETYGLFGMAYGSGAFGFGAVGGTSDQSISGLGVLDGYANSGLLVQYRAATGEAIRINLLDTGADTVGLAVNQKGTGDMVQFKDNSTLVSAVNDTGQLYFRDVDEDKIYFDGDGGSEKIEKTADGLKITSAQLTVNGNSRITGDLSVEGQSYFIGDVTIEGTLHGGSPLKIAGGLSVEGEISGNASTSNYATLSGSATSATTASYATLTGTSSTCSGNALSATTAGTTARCVVTVADVTVANGGNNDVNIGTNSYVRLIGPTGAYYITGFTGDNVSGKVIWVSGATAFACGISNEGTASTAANRILTSTGAGLVGVAAGGWTGTFVYDATSARWRVLSWLP
jgi:cytoskeletal protein CcmA (bactofilin family)